MQKEAGCTCSQSEYLFKELGKIGIASRTSVGVISLPGNAPVEIQIIAAIK